jgi:hypothetical protein
MANYTKHEQNRADLILGLEAGLAPPKFPMPKCACGAPARWESNHYPRVEWFCNEHLPVDLKQVIVNSPLYAGRDPFA